MPFNLNKAEKSLYSELEKLSSAWEALDRQVKSKVFDLSAMEERLSKNAMDVSCGQRLTHGYLTWYL